MDAGCAAALRARLQAHREVALAAALLHDADGTPQLFARRDLRLGGALWGFTGVGRRLDARRGGRALAARRYEDLFGAAPPQRAGGRLLPGRRVRHGGHRRPQPAPLDERFPLFFNDGDLCARLARAGLRVEIVPAATAAHGYGTSIARAQQADPARMRAEWVASLRRYARRWWPAPAYAVLTVALFADAVVGAALCLARRETRARCAARSAGSACPAGRRRC